MKIRDIILLAIRNLWRRKLRTFLTVMGVVIGSVSIIIMLSLGYAQQAQLDLMVKENDFLNTINIYPNAYHDPIYDKMPMPSSGIITEKEINKIKSINHVTDVVALENPSFPMSMKFGKYLYSSNIIGMSEQALKSQKINLIDGRFPEPNSKDLELILNTYRAENLFFDPNSKNFEEVDIQKVLKSKAHLILGEEGGIERDFGKIPPSKRSINFNSPNKKTQKIKVKIVGTFSMEGYDAHKYTMIASSKKIDELNDLYKKLTMSPSDYNKQKRKFKKTYNDISAKVDNIENIDYVIKEIQNMNLNANSNKEMIDSQKEANRVGQAILAGIGSISFIVAAIGIANTMVMSIYERTKEIGVMKVIGASVNNIRSLFLLEAGLIGFIGGSIGVIISIIISTILNKIVAPMFFANFLSPEEIPPISVINIKLILLALTFSFAVGIITGYFPAKKATKLSAIDALRTE